ncbi:MAG: DUF4861 family protein [Opitutales bacterium]
MRRILCSLIGLTVFFGSLVALNALDETFRENGFIVFEAEDFDVVYTSGNFHWQSVVDDGFVDVREGASGNAYLETPYLEREPRSVSGKVSYDITVEKPGKYYLWCRGLVEEFKGGSIYYEVNKSGKQGRRVLQWTTRSKWNWSNTGAKQGSEAVVEFKKAGDYTFSISIRDGLVLFDKWMLVPEDFNAYQGLWQKSLASSGLPPLKASNTRKEASSNDSKESPSDVSAPLQLLPRKDRSEARPINAPREEFEGMPPILSPRVVADTFTYKTDDFAWENDLVAFRVFGNGGGRSEGIDILLKEVDYPIWDRWYFRHNAEISNQKFPDEGINLFLPGSLGGVGGTRVKYAGRLRYLGNYDRVEVLERTKDRVRFTLFYEKNIQGTDFVEEKTITIESGRRFYSAESRFFKNGEIAVGLPILVGVVASGRDYTVMHSKEEGWAGTWETLPAGNLGIGVRVHPSRVEGLGGLKTDGETRKRLYFTVLTDEEGRIEYEAGYVWSKSGKIKAKRALEYMKSFSGSPLKAN